MAVDVRILSATHRDLADEVESGHFRQDLYYRLNVIELRVPPLRERREDIPLLAGHILQRLARDGSCPPAHLSASALSRLCNYRFPGNVRELENLLHRAVALSEGDELQVEWQGDAAPPQPSARPEPTPDPHPHGTPHVASDCPALPNDLQAWLDQQERDILVRALKESGFNRTATAARLGISLRQIRYRIARLNIAVPNDQDFLDEIG
jgi:two-component system response regulator PilR (NtrC family)